MQKEKSGFALFTGVVLGGLVGALAGVLFAPQPGEKTRKELGRKVVKLKDDGVRAAKDFQNNTVEPAVDNVRKTVDRESAQLRNKVDSEVKNIQSEIKKRTS